MVLEIPPADGGSITGTIMDAWQAALEDVGPAGVDKGKGGKYLILPPGYTDKAPDGLHRAAVDDFQGYALLRSILESGSDADVAKAVAYGKRIKLYPLSQAAKPPATTFVDAIDVVYDATIPYDVRFFQSLDRIVQIEPWLTRDKVMIDMLKSIGIEKGKPFNPDAKTQDILNAAAPRRRPGSMRATRPAIRRFYEGRQWAFPASPELSKTMANVLREPDAYPVDARGLAYSIAYSSTEAPGRGPVLPDDGEGQGRPRARRRQHVPAPRAGKCAGRSSIGRRRCTTARPTRSSAMSPRPSRSSQSPGLQKNADGSVDIYFGPKAPAGKESNWVPTSAGGQFEVLFRLYGPEKSLFDKKWRLPDIENVEVDREEQGWHRTDHRQHHDDQRGHAPVPVTADNFNRAETDKYFGDFVKRGALWQVLALPRAAARSTSTACGPTATRSTRTPCSTSMPAR